MPHRQEHWPCFMMNNKIYSGNRRFPLRIWLCLTMLLCCMVGLALTANANTGTCPQCLGELTTKSCGSYVCQQCGKTVVDNHQYQETVVTAATCTSPGVSDFTCMCGDSYTEETPPTGHAYTATGTANACQTCNICGKNISAHEPENRDANGKCQQYCAICNFVFYNTEHILETEVIEATCSTKGLKKTYCRVCNTVLHENEIGTTEHTWATKTTEPTCTTDGIATTYCSVCGEIKSETVSQKATGHTHEIVIEAATCTDSGWEITVCTICGAETSRIEIEPDPQKHTIETLVTEPTCVESGLSIEVCKFCGKESNRKIIEATGEHIKETQITDPTCAESGLKRVVCKVCSAEFSRMVLPKTNTHTLTTTISAATCGQPGLATTRCKICGVETERVETPATGRHTEIIKTTEATCEKDGVKIVKCEVCNTEIRRTVIYATGRHFAEADDGDPSTPVRCRYCGKTMQEGNDTSKNINNMNDLAFEIFKTIRTICIPLAIISFASCGWKFLGSIFFGNYVSMAGTDMMKAQKQLVLTILAVMLIVLFPRIFGAAITLFQEGFANGDGTIFKPWTPIDP